MADYHLLFTCEYHYLPYVFTTCQSILDSLEVNNDNQKDQLCFHIIIDDSVSSKQLQALIKLFTDNNSRCGIGINFELYHANPEIFEGFEIMRRGSWITMSNYYRLIFARMISPDVKRLLYLDVDVLLCDDIRKMFKQFPLANEVLCAVAAPSAFSLSLDPNAQEPVYVLPSKSPSLAAIEIPAKNYFNSGVMLINVNNWEQYNIEDKCLDIANDWSTPLHDQDLLNAACAGKVTYMNWDWNMCYDMYSLSVTGGILLNNNNKLTWDKLVLNDKAPQQDTLPNLVESPRLIHFTTDKPWDQKSSSFFIPARKEDKARLAQHQRWADTFKHLSPIYRKAKQLYQHL